MTTMEHPVRSDIQGYNSESDFDPLREFYGQWNTHLAEQYWSWLNHMFGKWECVNGRLVVAPAEALGNVWGESKMMRLLSQTAEDAGFFVMGTLNLAVNPQTWLQPDLCVLSRMPAKQDRLFVPASHFVMAVEFVSRSSRTRDLAEKPVELAQAGVPYYMTVQLDDDRRTVMIEQNKLVDGVYKVIASAATGSKFTMTEPFGASFHVDELLPPEA